VPIRTRLDWLGVALLVLVWAASLAWHLLGAPALRPVAIGFHVFFYLWYLEAWLRRVARAHIALRLALLVVLPAMQYVLVAYVYEHIDFPGEDIDDYVTSLHRWLWPSLVWTVVACVHAKLARRRHLHPLGALVLLLVGYAAIAVDDGVCSKLHDNGYDLGTRFLGYVCLAGAYLLLGISVQIEEKDWEESERGRAQAAFGVHSRTTHTSIDRGDVTHPGCGTARAEQSETQGPRGYSTDVTAGAPGTDEKKDAPTMHYTRV
jgi:hypothetical protein